MEIKSNQIVVAPQNTAYQKQVQTQSLSAPENQTEKNNLSPDASTKRMAAAQFNDQIKLSSNVTGKNLDTVKAIEQMHSRMNDLVKGVRETNEGINKAVEQISALQTPLNGIIKNFPPFPLESKERQELLMSYASIRQELMRMTIPHPPPPVYEQVKQLWEKTVEQTGEMLASKVPDLEKDSSDALVKEASAQLDRFSNGLAELSSGVTQALIGG